MFFSVSLSVRPHGTSSSNLTDFREISYFEVFTDGYWHISIFVKSDKKKQTIYLDNRRRVMIISWRDSFV
jgi:hypothetical protein